jgi:hypothetical protein
MELFSIEEFVILIIKELPDELDVSFSRGLSY